ncbi:MAG: hypothetical protein IK119_10225, partial [Bacteroidales bacterium]|nr:hypothetical protein [Bacteroidales bacterium]
VEEYHSVNSFCQGVCICTELIRGGRWGTQLVGYDTNGYVVFRIDNFDSKASYCMDGIRETYKYENYFLHNSIIPVRGGFYNLSGEFHPMDKLRYPIYKPWTYKRVMPSTRGFEVLKDGKWIFMDEKGKEYPNEESLNTDIA